MSPIYTPGKLVMAQTYTGIDDPDAAVYIAAVEAADGQTLETATKVAIHSFVKGCKNDGIWPALKASCILAGARTLEGALVPLVGAAPTNVGGLFVAGDYNRETGLVGNGSTKYLSTNRAGNADPQGNQHAAVYVTTAASGAGSGMGYIGAGVAGAGTTNIAPLASGSGGVYTRSQSSDTSNRGNLTATGFIGLARNNSSTYNTRLVGATSSVTQASQTPDSTTYTIHSLGAGYYSNGRISFYSIGESLDLALLDARVTALMNAFAAAIP